MVRKKKGLHENISRKKEPVMVPVHEVLSKLQRILDMPLTTPGIIERGREVYNHTPADALEHMVFWLENLVKDLQKEHYAFGEIEKGYPVPEDWSPPPVRRRNDWAGMAAQMEVGDSVQFYQWSEASSLKSALHRAYGEGSSVGRKVGGTSGREIVRVWRTR